MTTKQVASAGGRRIMRRWLVAVALTMAMGGGVVACWSPARVAAINLTMWWTVRLAEDRGVSMQRRLDAWVPAGAVLVVGDSLAVQLPPRRIGLNVTTFAVGGALIEDVATALAGRDSLRRIAALVVVAGTNDILHRSPDASEAALRGLLAALPAELPVLMCTTPPIDPAVHRERSSELIAAWNARLPAILAGRPSSWLVDTHSALADEAGHLPPALHQGDGLHLNPAGNERLAAAIRAGLARVLADAQST